MISEIQIANLGVIDKALLPLGPGFTVLTGETGAGKTMVVTALGLLLGDRSDSGAVRVGSGMAFVDGRWIVATNDPIRAELEELGAQFEDDELILSRSISNEGRSKASVGGRSVPVSLLSELGDRLVAVHGQSEQLRLKSALQQRLALDSFAGVELAEKLETFRTQFRTMQRLERELEEFRANSEQHRQEAELLREALSDFENLEPSADEDTELAARAERLRNLEELRLAADQAKQAVRSDEQPYDASSRLVEARAALEKVVSLDGELTEILTELHDAEVRLGEIAVSLSGYLSGLESDGGQELEQVETRRAELTMLARKYGGTLQSAIDYAQGASDRLLALDRGDDRILELETELGTLRAALTEAAHELTALRLAAAAELSERVTAELASLALPNARLVVEVTQGEELAAHGRDSVAILLQPHSGSEPRPLAKGASGGELSRIMLAIEVVMASTNPVPTFIFDEVDAGVGGAAAIEVGRRLAMLAEHAQVIVVTHLAQVAAFANNHLRVTKHSDTDSTVSNVEVMEGEERVTEMARLLSGLSESESGLHHARELLDIAARDAQMRRN